MAVMIPNLPPVAVPAPVGVRPMPVWLTKAYVVAADIAAIALTLTLAYNLRTALPGNAPIEGASSQHFRLALLSTPLWIGCFAYYRLYTVRFLTTRIEEFRRLTHAVGAGVLGTAVIGFMLRWYVARGWLVLSFVFALPVLAAEREVVRRSFARLRKAGRMRRPTLVVGANAEGAAICRMLRHDRRFGHEVLGVLDCDAPLGTEVYDDRVVVGTVDEALPVALQFGATSVIVATTAVDSDRTNVLVRQLTDAGIHVELSSALADIAAGRLTVRPLGRFPVLYVEPVHRRGWRPAAKRIFDVVASAGALLLLSPLWLILAILVKLDSRGPTLFRQERVGKDGLRFNVHKFRTMVVDAEARLPQIAHLNEGDGPLFKMANDPRVTRIGRALRKLSLDEIPQLWNVLRGEMSLVGPRPALAKEMEAWTPALFDRLRVRPGLTGMWQVSGRSNASFEEYVRLDLYYVDNWSLLTDIAIVAKTVPTVLLRQGAL